MTTLTITKACTMRLLRKLQENIEWPRIKIKSSKSRSISIVKGKLSDQCFQIGDEPIPTVTEKTVKSPGRWYEATHKDTTSGLESIDKSLLPGTGPQRGKEAGAELVLAFTARERDCNGCLYASRAKLACSLKAARRLLPTVCRGWGVVAGYCCSALARATVCRFESRQKTLKRIPPRRNTAARLNFHQLPEGTGRRSQQVPGEGWSEQSMREEAQLAEQHTTQSVCNTKVLLVFNRGRGCSTAKRRPVQGQELCLGIM
ncbi:uncharacterized protein LOC123983467 [Micropterus dolomieu]|uniref:uncharacterized protein LOC123983467 n=1 Tax=Micropterus dolomieu TaxID=147949 RepID=UPI001E8E97E1|nr:uncharacterized protein LOC123983467 [Micropterus dolomieu]